jgi:hypothetical protein
MKAVSALVFAAVAEDSLEHIFRWSLRRRVEILATIADCIVGIRV